MDEIIKVIRSLLIVSNEGLSIQQINKVYREEVGEWIPFKKFGYNSLEDFLRASGQFSGKRTATDIIVSAKIAQNSAHIVQFRNEQRVSSSERKYRKKKRNDKNAGRMISKTLIRKPFTRSNMKNQMSMATVTSNEQTKKPFTIAPKNKNELPNLYARLAPKAQNDEQMVTNPELSNVNHRPTREQSISIVNGCKIEESIVPSTPSVRTRLLKMLQEVTMKHEHKESLPETEKSSTKRLISFEPKTVIIDENINENRESRSVARAFDGMPKLVSHINAQLQLKQTQYNTDIDQLCEKINGTTLQDITDSPSLVRKSELQSHLQQKQLDKDCEEISWTRSVRKSGNGIRITFQC